MVGTVDSDRRSEQLFRNHRALQHDIDAGKHRVNEMLQRKLVLGTGRSTALGWFELKGFDRDNRRADYAKFVVSCGDDEREYIFAQTLRHTGCKAVENSGDDIHTVVEIVPCLTS